MKKTIKSVKSQRASKKSALLEKQPLNKEGVEKADLDLSQVQDQQSLSINQKQKISDAIEPPSEVKQAIDNQSINQNQSLSKTQDVLHDAIQSEVAPASEASISPVTPSIAIQAEITVPVIEKTIVSNQNTLVLSPAAGQVFSDAMINLFVAGIGLIQMATKSDSSSSSSASNETSNEISGSFTAGPIISAHGLKVKAYQADGTFLGEAALAEDGSYKLTYKGDYSGAVLLRVVDTTEGADYIDEGTGQAKDMSLSGLHAVIEVKAGEPAVAQISPLTDLVARQLGLDISNEEKPTLTVTDIEKVKTFNQAAAKMFGLGEDQQITDIKPTPIYDKNGNAQTSDAYGKVLALISAMELQGKTTEQVLKSLSDGINLETRVFSLAAFQELQTAGTQLVATSKSGAFGIADAQSTLLAPASTVAGQSPIVMIVADKSTLLKDQTTTIYFNLTKGSNDFSQEDVTCENGSLSNWTAISSTVYQATFTPIENTNTFQAKISVQAAKFNVDGVLNIASPILSVEGDTQAPSMVQTNSLSISSESELTNNTLVMNDVVTIAVTLNEKVIVNTMNGSPKLRLKIGDKLVEATYEAANQSTEKNKLTFTYTIQAGDSDTDGISIDADSIVLNGATIKDALGNAVIIKAGSEVTPVLAHAAVLDDGSYKVDAVDFMGTIASDTLEGTSASDIIVGNSGDDVLWGRGADVLLGGAGNDIFKIDATMITALQNAIGSGGNTTYLSRINGGDGLDTIALNGAELILDLTLIANQGVNGTETASRIASIEKIDLTGTGNNIIKLDVEEVNDMTEINLINSGTAGWQNGTYVLSEIEDFHQLIITGDAGDEVQSSGWGESQGTVSHQGITYNVYQQGISALFINQALSVSVL